jgi:hypothetical protein
MPGYDLQAGTASGQSVDCGQIIVTGSGTVKHVNQGQSGGGDPVVGGSYSPAGGGSASNPQPGDTLYLNNLSAQGSDGNWYNFPGTATFQDANGSQKKGYYHSASLEGQVGDWDCEDDGSGLP